MTNKKGKNMLITVLFGIVILTASVLASPPHPDLRARVAASKAATPYFMQHYKDLHAKGICTGDEIQIDENGNAKIIASKVPQVTGPFKVLAVLVEFSDHPATGNATFFDSLLFDSLGSTVHDYYNEISYGQLDLISVNLPSSIGWQTAPQTYAYYVNNQNGTGAYPQNTQKLAEDLVDQIDGVVDFSQYDNDGNGTVDVLIIIHSGTGAEFSGSNSDIWSHKWGITPRLKDGVYISSYTIQPEFWTTPGDMTIGVYSHELAHGFGLPDLYDTDASQSRGLGKWGLMAYGSWLGATGMGESPAHPSAWSRIKMGFATPTIISTNITSQQINQVETSGEIYRLWTSGNVGSEYFLVENRQRTGYDSFIPGDGLLIWHIDDAKSGNTQEWWPGQTDANHYRVALEQADGLWELEKKLDFGDGDDPFPGGTSNVTFDATTLPNSNSYTSGGSLVKVANITPTGPTMYADLVVGLSAGIDDGIGQSQLPITIALDQNYPNPFNPMTTISFTLTQVADAQLDIYNVTGQRVRQMYSGSTSPGTVTVIWDGTNDAGNAVASGIYLYRLSTESESEIKKMILLR